MKRINSGTIEAISYPSEPLFSPCGNKILYRVTDLSVEKNSYTSSLWLYEKNSKRELKYLKGHSCFAWKNSKEIVSAFTSDDKSELWLTNLEDDLAVCFSHVDFKVSSIWIINGSDLILAGKYDNQNDRCSSWSVATELPVWKNGTPGIVSGFRTRLYHYHTKDNTVTAVSDENMEVEEVSCRGDCLVFAGCKYDTKYDPRKEVDAYFGSTEITKCLVPPGEVYITGLDIVKDQVVIMAYKGKHKDPWHPKNVYSVSIEGGSLNLLLEQQAIAPGCSVITDSKYGGGYGCRSDGEYFYFISSKRKGSVLVKVDLSGRLEELFKNITADIFDVRNGNVCLRGLSVTGGPELYLNGEPMTDLNKCFPLTYMVSRPEYHAFKNRSGLEIDGWIMKPTDYDPEKKYPAVLSIHGGPRLQFTDVFHLEHQILTSQGYFVFYCNPRGSEGRGVEYGELYGKYGTIDYEDLMDFCDDVLTSYPQIDKERLGVTGGSYGGFMTNWIIGHTNRFKAAVSDRSLSNMGLAEVASDIGFYWEETEMGTGIDKNPEKMWDGSPLKYAFKAKTPTLFMQSDEDYRCLYIDAVAMFTVLRKNSVDSRLCLFHNESHNLSRTGKINNRIHRYEETVGWFDKYLK